MVMIMFAYGGWYIGDYSVWEYFVCWKKKFIEKRFEIEFLTNDEVFIEEKRFEAIVALFSIRVLFQFVLITLFSFHFSTPDNWS